MVTKSNVVALAISWLLVSSCPAQNPSTRKPLPIINSVGNSAVRKSPPKSFTGRVTDLEGQPISGASVVLAGRDIRAFGKTETLLSDSKGAFLFEMKDSDLGLHLGLGLDYFVVHKPGFAMDAKRASGRPLRVQLSPVKPVALRILNEAGRPISNAKVSVGLVQVDGQSSAGKVPKSIADSTAVVSREDGWAILRATRPQDLRSVSVSASGYGTQTFAARFSAKRFQVLRLQKSHPNSVQVSRDGEPIANWKIICSWNSGPGAVQESRTTVGGHLLPIGIEFDAATDTNGKVLIPHAIAHQKLWFSALDSTGEYRGSNQCQFLPEVSGRIHAMDFESFAKETGLARSFAVLDADTGEPIPGVEFMLRRKGREWDNQKCVSDEQGLVEVKLSPYLWDIGCSKAPAGIYKHLVSGSSINVPADVHALPPVLLWKAKTLRGKLVDVNLPAGHSRWITIGWAGKKQNGWGMGRFESDGAFQIAIPAFAKATSFSIEAYAGRSGNLLPKSEEPLELTHAKKP